MKILYIEWEDSCTSQGWDWPEGETMNVRSVGMLVRSRKKSVTISTSRSDNGRYMDQLTIPRSAIRKIRKIRS